METRERQAAPASDRVRPGAARSPASSSRVGRSTPQHLVIGGTVLDDRCWIELEALQTLLADQKG